MEGQRLRAASADAMEACANVLKHNGGGPSKALCNELQARIKALADARAAVSEEALNELRGSESVINGSRRTADGSEKTGVPGEFDRPLYAAHELGYVVELAATTVRGIAAADSRPWLARLTGRRPRGLAFGEAGAAERIAVGHLDWHSAWLQNSVRGAVGLALAVFLARLTGQQQGFWIVLGALSVLRSNALSTGATAVRALLGTVVGIVIGGAIIVGIGTNPTILWFLLPIAVFVAAFTPEVVSFVVGQAAFTVTVIILFNIIAPKGWRIGVLRIEDIALGCLASVDRRCAVLAAWRRCGARRGDVGRVRGRCRVPAGIDRVPHRTSARRHPSTIPRRAPTCGSTTRCGSTWANVARKTYRWKASPRSRTAPHASD